MTAPGIELSHAARMAVDAQRAVIATVVHIEAADAVLTDLDQWLARVDLSEDDIFAAVNNLGCLAERLQRLCDAYGHAEVLRRSQERGAP
jgi:hypothetical protein